MKNKELKLDSAKVKQGHFKYLFNVEVPKCVCPMYATRMAQDLHSPLKRGLGGQEPGHMRHVLQGELETQTFQAWLSMACGPTSQGNQNKIEWFGLYDLILNLSMSCLKQ